MSTIYKYISRDVLKYYGIVLAIVVGIYAIVDFLEKVDDFLEAKVPLVKALSFLIYKSPYIVAQITPVGILLSVLIVFSLMKKYNETIALKASGFSIYRLIKPIAAIGIVLTIFLFFVSECIVPASMGKANRIWLKEVRKDASVALREKNLWIKGRKLIAYIKYYNQKEQAIYGATFHFFDDLFRLSKRIDAARGTYQQGRWALEGAMVQQRVETGEHYTVSHHDQWLASLDFVPDDLKQVAKKSEEMGFAELLDYIKKVESEGYDASIYRVDLHAKIALPLVCLIMAAIGSGIALRGNLGEGMPVSISYGIVIAFLYHVCHSFCMSLGYGDALPPVVAAWTANLIFACLGGFLLLNAE